MTEISTNETDLRILTNMAFWQSRDWTRCTDSTYDLRKFKKDGIYNRPIVDAWRCFRRMQDYDVVHTMGARESLYYGLLCALTFRQPKHVMTEVFLDQPKPNSLRWRIKTMLYRLVAKRSWGILTNSTPEIVTTLDRLLLPQNKVHYLPMHTNIHLPERSTVDGGFVLSAGRSLRDYETMLKAAEKIPAKVVIICGHDDVPHAVLPDNVKLYREVPYESYLDHLRRCTLVALPLKDTVRSTGQVVMLGAMAVGKPVITTRSPGTMDHVRNGENGYLVEEEDHTALAARVNELLNDPAKATAMADAALEEIKTKYTFDIHADKRLKMIRMLYNRKS